MNDASPNPSRRRPARPARPTRRAALAWGARGLALALAAGPAIAQPAYPSRAVRLVVNFPPGGVADQIARVLARQMQESLGQPFVVENRAGGNGNIGAGEVARAAPDGYTLLLAPSGVITVNGLLYRGLGFDPMKDLEPVASQLAISSYLVVHPKVPAATLREFLEHARANPGRMNYGTPGSGSSSHLAAELLRREAGVEAVHVPYKGAAPALNGLLGGEIEYMFDPGTGLPHVKSGRLRLLAVAGANRDPQFPDTPTVTEVLGREFDASTLFGVLAPAGTPRAVIAVLDREIARSMQTAEMKQVIGRLGANPRHLGPADYAAQLARIHQTMGVLVRQNNLTAD
jgi:tripartite-type tricarboxylate transporter receptor subunit TctC